MADYSKEEIRRIEEKWRKTWDEKGVYRVENSSSKPKYYVLDMFPYPSGAGLHVGHPLGYIASDIVARFKRLKGFNVLHPMGFDAFGLPAEQYALEHGIHPAVSTAQNIENFKRQLNQIGFSYDWSREVQTCDKKYYQWTQWIFLQIFDSWYNRKKGKAERISELVRIFEAEGNTSHPFPNAKSALTETGTESFTNMEWKSFPEKVKQSLLMQYRLAYLAYTDVNWCEALGTVLANDEVINGVSYRGGFPVVKRQMRQWSLRITEYAERLLKGLQEIDYSESMKEIQRNWIGKSVGCLIKFDLTPLPPLQRRGGGQMIGPSPEERANPKNKIFAQDFIFTSEAKTWSAIQENARENRKNPTEGEEKLWQALRNSSLGYRFRRQHSIDRFIVDLVCIEKKLVVEVDGPIHERQKPEDNDRTLIIEGYGFKVIRFTNEVVLSNITGVLQKIKDELSSPGPSPSPPERGLGGEVWAFTTRPDTIFGVDFIVLAPEHDLVKKITTTAQQEDVEKYMKYVEGRSEIDRMAEVKKITGCFTGAFAVNPLSQRELPVWISEYVLVGYGTGAIMGVPCGDERDHKFARHFNIPITNIIGTHYNGIEANPTYDAVLENSGFINGMIMRDAIEVVVKKIEELGVGKKQVNYKMRDAGWSRQRYWGEPFPVIFREDIPFAMDEKDLPLLLPETNNFKPSGTGEGPLANLTDWVNLKNGDKRDSNTMPTHAGAAWYFLRYMDPNNEKAFADKKALNYWGQVDVYIGGSEHAVAHLLYSRLWVKILHDLGYLNFDEPFKKLINQGKITGYSKFIFRVNIDAIQSPDPVERLKIPPLLVSKEIADRLLAKTFDENAYNQILEKYYQKYDELNPNESWKPLFYPLDEEEFLVSKLHVPIEFVEGDHLKIEEFKDKKIDFRYAVVIKNSDDRYLCGTEPEKMSKSYGNVVNPDDIIEKYGADTLRMYEMFLGPLEQSKPWNTNGIDGVYKFLRKFWNQFHDSTGNFKVTSDEPGREELKVLHKTIKKVQHDIENYSFNTSVSEFMICANELSALKCNKRSILEPLVITLAPFAPFVTEELWEKLGHPETVFNATFPDFDEQYLTESSFNYPISINGKVRTQMNFALDMPKEDIEKLVMASEAVKKWTEGKSPKKVIIVPGKIVNVVV